jgi:hypothetical protein
MEPALSPLLYKSSIKMLQRYGRNFQIRKFYPKKFSNKLQTGSIPVFSEATPLNTKHTFLALPDFPIQKHPAVDLLIPLDQLHLTQFRESADAMRISLYH